MPVHLHALLGQRACRRHKVGPAPGAEARVRRPETRHLPRHRDRERAPHVAVLLDGRPAEHVGAFFAGERIVRRLKCALGATIPKETAQVRFSPALRTSM